MQSKETVIFLHAICVKTLLITFFFDFFFALIIVFFYKKNNIINYAFIINGFNAQRSVYVLSSLQLYM